MSTVNKILIVSRSFYPQNSPRSFRATELAKEFARQGHEVTVITPKSHEIHQMFELEHKIKIKDLGKPRWKEVNIKGKRITALIKRLVKRFSKLLFEYPDIELMKMVKKALKQESGYDLLISIAVPYPIHWGIAASRTRKKPIAKIWVADCGDPYMGAENDSFKKPIYFRFIEKWFCRKVDYLTVPTEGSKEGYYPEFWGKIKVIPQGFKVGEIKKADYKPVPGKSRFAYAGLFIKERRDPKEFCRYLLDLDNGYEFHVYTKNEDLIKPWAEKSKGRIQIKGFLPREELLFELSKLDFMINFDNAGGKQTPSKLIDYAIIGKPVLSIKTGELDKINLDRFLIGDYSGGLKLENLEQYHIENVTKKFLELTS